MIKQSMISPAAHNDSDLVSESLSGNRDAFGLIVSRYQSLVCSLAYSATGSLSQSEDLAQDTFVTAWKQLRELREPEKLRAWLCGIARNLINSSLRKQGREPSHRAEPLDEMPEGPSPEPLPVETTISREEAEILWRSLERIPGIYREPLILFYREHQSVEAVAANLGLAEDAVKQRLSRGRKLLQEQFLAFVEGALAQTAPGKTFTLSVLSALPAMTLSTKAAALGAVAAKGSAAAKSAGLLGVLGAVFSPLLLIFGNYASYRMSVDEAHTDEERGRIKRIFRNSLLTALGLSAVSALPLLWWYGRHPDVLVLLFAQTIVIYFLVIAGFVLSSLPRRRRYLARVLAKRHGGNFPDAAFEYRSGASLLGLPLVHVRIGDRFDVLRGPVKAWFAVGSSHAIGVLFASGGLAVAPISFGGIAIGLVPFGAIALGMFSLGAISAGIWAYGAAAVGWQVFSGCGFALNAAMGGVVAARDFAIGGIAHAAQANTEIAREFCRQSSYFRIAQAIANHGFWLTLLWVIPVLLQSRVIARARRRRELVNA
ncbi:MAG TPA: RNA polymerase sigma factor [Verrucomicrobiae bacterium]|jgi:RNA polymerase sigma factor (sigma-70 family)|nr:RNA polymerase sigma factor [Verrucomicrobiae bacterium]